MNDEPSISIEAISKSFDEGRIPVLHDVHLAIRHGERVALWGASGSGKTTLLNLIGGLDIPDCGQLRTYGIDPTEEGSRLRLRREIVGFVFQLHNLIPDLSVRENLMIPCIANGTSDDEAEARMRQLMERLEMGHRIEQRMQNLSGGERQRVAIARALMHQPKVVLADEPTGALDEKTGASVFELLGDLAKDVGVTVVVATHERRFAEACDRIFRVTDGRVEEL